MYRFCGFVGIWFICWYWFDDDCILEFGLCVDFYCKFGYIVVELLMNFDDLVVKIKVVVVLLVLGDELIYGE